MNKIRFALLVGISVTMLGVVPGSAQSVLNRPQPAKPPVIAAPKLAAPPRTPAPALASPNNNRLITNDGGSLINNGGSTLINRNNTGIVATGGGNFRR